MPPSKSWKKSPLVIGLQLALMFCLGLVLRGSDPLHIVLSKLYPEEDSIGGIGIEMSEISGLAPMNERTNLFLIRHELDDSEPVTLMRRGGHGKINHLLAGIDERNGTAAIPVDGMNKTSFMELNIPPRSLSATAVLTAPGQLESARYFLSTAKVEKEFKQPGDLVVMTLNEARNFRLLYWLSMATLFFVGFGMSRFAVLEHPDESEGESPS